MLIAARAIQGVGAALLDARQPRDPGGELPPRRPRGGDRGLVGARRHHHRHRPVPGRVAGGGGLVAPDLPHQPAARRGGALGDARHPRVARRVGAGPAPRPDGRGAHRVRPRGDHLRPDGGPDERLDRAGPVFLGLLGVARAGRVRARRAAQPAPAGAARHVRVADVLDRQRADVPRLRGPRGGVLPAADRAPDRRRVLADRVGRGARPHDHGDAAAVQARGAPRGPHRTAAADGPRARSAPRRACSCCCGSGRTRTTSPTSFPA